MRDELCLIYIEERPKLNNGGWYNPVDTSLSNDVEKTLYRCYRRWYNVVSTSFDHDMPAGNGDTEIHGDIIDNFTNKYMWRGNRSTTITASSSKKLTSARKVLGKVKIPAPIRFIFYNAIVFYFAYAMHAGYSLYQNQNKPNGCQYSEEDSLLQCLFVVPTAHRSIIPIFLIKTLSS